MDAYFFGKEIAALENNPDDTITLRLLILGVINNIVSNHKDRKTQFLATVRNLQTLYKQIPEDNSCTSRQFDLIKNKINDEIIQYNIMPFLMTSLYKQAS